MSTPTRITCLRCGYDLRGTPPASPCPECGLSSSFSRNPPPSLAAAPPSWPRTLALGSACLLLSILAIPIVPNVFDHFIPIGPKIPPAEVSRRIVLRTDVLAATFAFHALSIWILTTREPLTPRLSPRQLLIWLTRLCSLGPALALTSQHYLLFISRTLYRHSNVTMICLFCLYVPVPALTFLHLRRLATRIGRPRLAEHAAIVGVGLSSCLATFIALAFLPIPNTLTVTFTILPVACLLTFTPWGLFLLARLTLAFRRAISESRTAWQQADSAAAATSLTSSS
jgi:hypothetical protein